MKKLYIFFLIMMITKGFVFAEDIKVKTGDVFGNSMTDYFTPVAKGIRGSWTCVSSIKNVEKDLWCLTLIVDSKANQIPKTFEYYVRPGDVISVCRFPDIQKELQLKVKSIKWNEAVLDVVD
ncbi:MAG: hypothetical protein MSH65_06765 [Spirochaetia bacterium]|nr:hypothetical protein [Spirochaetia bacterium]MDY3722922.1 hypothetical protein [Treponema sp.]MDY5818832.1 hypothetical protein [Treponema sp.]